MTTMDPEFQSLRSDPVHLRLSMNDGRWIYIRSSNILLLKDDFQTTFVDEDGLNRSIDTHTAIHKVGTNVPTET